MKSIELRVVVITNDDRDGTPERVEAEVRRALAHPFGDRVYVEATTPRHPVSLPGLS